jgi:hypothetical protein
MVGGLDVTKPEIDSPEACEMCRGAGAVATGPWGSRPSRKTCPDCGGTGRKALGLSAEHQRTSSEVAAEMRANLSDDSLVPEHDTIDRALWRVDTILKGFYDMESEEPVQALGDLMTDLLHWCDVHDRSWRGAQDRAEQMVQWEREDWGLDRIWSSDRMFRKTGPIVRQRRSER